MLEYGWHSNKLQYLLTKLAKEILRFDVLDFEYGQQLTTFTRKGLYIGSLMHEGRSERDNHASTV